MPELPSERPRLPFYYKLSLSFFDSGVPWMPADFQSEAKSFLVLERTQAAKTTFDQRESAERLTEIFSNHLLRRFS